MKTLRRHSKWFVLSMMSLIIMALAPSSHAHGGGRGDHHPGSPPGSNPGYGHERGRGQGRGPGRGRPPEHRRGQPIPRAVPRHGDEDGVDAAFFFDEETRNLRCENLGAALVRLSNRMLGVQKWVKTPSDERVVPPGWRRGLRPGERDEMRGRWDRHLKSQAWWQNLWSHVLEAYRSCDVECFEEGIVVGQLSAAGYCGMSVGLDGLIGPGLGAQAPLPVCETATYAGCISSYRQTAQGFEGCSNYINGNYQSVFNEFMSQDCHLD